MIHIQDSTQCYGCTACRHICNHGAISMHTDGEGFVYPVVDLGSCVECHLCEKVCPKQMPSPHTRQVDAQHVYAVRNRDKAMLHRSASGGAFGVLAHYVLLEHGVVYGVAWQDHMVARHVAVERVDELWKLHDSKYVQSVLGDTFPHVRRHLQEERLVLFVGTPCQVAGLMGYLRRPYPNLITCDLVCHSVASPLIFADFIDFVEKKTGKRIVNISLRDKSRGWNNSTNRIDFADHSSILRSYWGGVWATAYPLHLITRPSCHDCQFSSFQRCGDITLGDFWGIQRAHPSFYSPEGVSLLLTNTPKGEELFMRICNQLEWLESTQTAARQPALCAPLPPSPFRAAFWKDYDVGGFSLVIKKYWGYTFIRKLKLQALPIYQLLQRKK